MLIFILFSCKKKKNRLNIYFRMNFFVPLQVL